MELFLNAICKCNSFPQLAANQGLIGRARPLPLQSWPLLPSSPCGSCPPIRCSKARSIPRRLPRLAKERGFPAIAICDRNGLYGTVAIRIGLPGTRHPAHHRRAARRGAGGRAGRSIISPLFAQDEAGWNNLCNLVSRAHLDRPLELEPHVALADLDGHTDGLIALTGAAEGALTRLLAEGQRDAAARLSGAARRRCFRGASMSSLRGAAMPIENGGGRRR